MFEKKLHELKEKILKEIEVVKEDLKLSELETKYLGRKGELTSLLKSIKDLSPEMKKTAGKLANDIKNELEEVFRKKSSGTQSEDDFVDITLPGKKPKKGNIHPITLVQNELEDLFSSLGFLILDGPELESDFYNFEALNIPANHPARDMQDTFYVKDPGSQEKISDMVMRTHTSPVQARAMRKYGAPLRCVAPGRVFRCEATDAVHEHTFNQMEGLMIGKNISMGNLIAVMKELLKGVFGRDMEVRIRPGYFPFVEPGIELDIKCTICGGAKCPACKHSGWLEILPAGMVHPKVLEHGGIDPKVYSGFAFGLGLTRLVMMKYGIDDIRLFNGGDLRFLEQF
jgi:phenylalanyl-tRNA synthetase alpha chain